MPLTQEDKNQLYSQAFANNAKAMLGESAFAALDLKTNLDVVGMEMGVLRDELKAAQAEVALKEEANEVLAKEVERVSRSLAHATTLLNQPDPPAKTKRR